MILRSSQLNHNCNFDRIGSIFMQYKGSKRNNDHDSIPFYLPFLFFYFPTFTLEKDLDTNSIYNLEETSEAQLVIDTSLVVETRALCCKCLKLCSILT